MLAAQLPADEEERLTALVGCGLLDTDPEPAFDDIAQLASMLCEVPIALVSLVDRSRQWFKARVGLTVSETPREISFCAHAVVAREPLIVPDALADARFADNPLVTGEPYLRFYAGIPLAIEGGQIVGTLCVIDRVPRELTSSQRDALTMLARRAGAEISLRRKLSAQASAPPEPPLSGDSTRQISEAPTLLRSARRVELPVPIGSVVTDRYRVLRLLGAGGMGLVVEARDLDLERNVAIKFMLAEVASEPLALERFVREAQVLLSLTGDHIARVYDLGNLPSGVPFIVMELLEGQDLSSCLAQRGALSPRESLKLLLEACLAVEAAHAQGVLHRDLKPGNLFLARCPDGSTRLRVLDFGISKLARRDSDAAITALTRAADALGSPHYMSPEQMVAAGGVDARTDIWSLGVVLYELLTGHTPYAGGHALEVCARVLTTPPPDLSVVRPELPASICSIVARCLQKEPGLRYASATELAHDLRDALWSL